MNIGPLNHRARIEYKVVTRDATYGTEAITWTTLATRWCSINDMLPRRGEAVSNTLAVNVNRSRIRMRYCADITSSMRFAISRPTEAIYQIVSGPAEIGIKDGVEFIVEQVSS
ncbi:head-tail adaptor protein [Propionivibrio sp.]|uniref:head-tail adaptor protein n=1 Tax=Propionivibrio sp. TaxID=2212460 RepID=UPI003BF0CA4D